MTESRRAWYRIVYPLAERPTIEVGRSLHEIIDCSERGLRYELNHQRMPAIGDTVQGLVHFHRGESLLVEGMVLRAFQDFVVLALDPPLPFAQMMAEQRYLRGKGFLRA